MLKGKIVGVSSIVAVHGLNPAGSMTHGEATWTKDGKLWLKDFLPERLPNARVLLFGYNSKIAFDTTIAGVRQVASVLLNRLKNKRKVGQYFSGLMIITNFRSG